MLVLALLALSSVSVQLEETSDLEPELKASLLEELSQALAAQTGDPFQVIDCQREKCAPKDVTSDQERVHLLIFGGPTRVSIIAERVGAGRSLKSSALIPHDATDRRPILERLARELYPNQALSPRLTPTVVVDLSPPPDAPVARGPRAWTIVGLSVAGLSLVGSVTFGVLALSSQSELSEKMVYDDEVPGLEQSVARNKGLALGLLGAGIGAGILAVISEVTR